MFHGPHPFDRSLEQRIELRRLGAAACRVVKRNFAVASDDESKIGMLNRCSRFLRLRLKLQVKFLALLGVRQGISKQ